MNSKLTYQQVSKVELISKFDCAKSIDNKNDLKQKIYK